jgi:hypothetical protein
MIAWAKWTAKTVLVTAGFAAAGGGLAGVALAGTAGSTVSTNARTVSALDGNDVGLRVSVSIDACGNAATILGIAAAGCEGGAGVTGAGVSGAGQIPVIAAVNACGNVIGNGVAHCRGGVSTPLGGTLLGAAPRGTGIGTRIGAGPSQVGRSQVGSGPAHGTTPLSPVSSSKLAGVGALPGVSNLPVLSALSSPNGGMSSTSLAALAIGALLAGATALKVSQGVVARKLTRPRGLGAASGVQGVVPRKLTRPRGLGAASGVQGVVPRKLAAPRGGKASAGQVAA